MRKLDENTITKVCTKCGKTKVIEIGFYKNPSNKDGYRGSCKVCDEARKRENDIEKRDGKYDIHTWKSTGSYNIDQCQRCGVLRKKEAYTKKVGHWLKSYLVDGKWTDDRPQVCQLIDKPKNNNN